MIEQLLPSAWRELLAAEFERPYFKELDKFLEAEYAEGQIFPPREQIFRALEWTPIDRVRVVIIGQDPYHDDGQANGLCFSVADGVPHPPSLRNIFKEITAQYGTPTPTSGNLERWAHQGVLLINAVLTVRAHQAASHANRGWEEFTDAIVNAVSTHHDGVIYMLWGNYAKKKGAKLNEERNCLLRAAHPSPLSVRHRAKDPAQFIAANNYLTAKGEEPIVW
ncbi:MAG: uracil-DNA glycosylase [Rikenellaceae bacterium]